MIERTPCRCFCPPLEQRGRRKSVSVELFAWLGRIAPQVRRRNRLPVEVALRALPDRLRGHALSLAERDALADGETHFFGAAVGHRLGDPPEIDAPERGWRGLFPPRHRTAK